MEELRRLVPSDKFFNVIGERDRRFYHVSLSNHTIGTQEELEEVIRTADMAKMCREEDGSSVYILAGESSMLGEYSAYYSDKHGLRVVPQHMHHKYARGLGWGA